MSHPKSVKDWVQISVLGSGSFGTVMLWKNTATEDFIAIKMCKFQKTCSLSKKQKDRWQMEVDFLQSINHKNVIGFKHLDTVLAEMLDKYNPTKLPLLSMEYCTKGNLRRYLTNEPIKICGLQESDIRDILEDISLGLNYLHSKKITHRDIKPDNIVLQHCNNRKGQTIYKIIDLGYAKELDDATLSFVGTLHYLAPEIFQKSTYDPRVDYWSMGIMVFEITCGVLPFLPEMTPFERFAKIKDKGPDDICIYFSNSGSITNSSEIKRENFVTSCFKQYIEFWLRRVLQMEPENRSFINSLSPFDYLRFILDRKVIQVFSVYKQEYYSYEINNSTRFGTLKDWVSRDIKIPKTNLLFLFRSQDAATENKKENVLHYTEDNTLLEYLINNNNEAMLYVYKKDIIFCEASSNSKIPNLVKELFNYKANFHQKNLRNVYRQTLFYVYSENRSSIELKRAFFCLIQFIEDLFHEIKNKYIKATSEFEQVLAKIEQFSVKRKNDLINNKLELGQESGECLKYLEILFSNVEMLAPKLNDFGKQYKMLKKVQEGIDSSTQEIDAIFQKWDIQAWFDKINGSGFLEKTKNGEASNLVQLKPIRDVVSETMRMRFHVLTSEVKLKDYFKDVCNIMKWSQDLLLWVDNFISNVQKLLTNVEAVQNKHDQIIRVAVNDKKLGKVKSSDCKERIFYLVFLEFAVNFTLDDTHEIIKENALLRCQFADLLAEKVTSHKNFVDELGSYFEDFS